MGKWSEETVQRKSAEFTKIAATFQGASLAKLEEAYFVVREEKDKLNGLLKPVNEQIMVLEALLSERFAEDNLKTVNFDTGNRITVTFSCPPTVQSKEEFISWLKASGREFELTVPHQSLGRIVKEFQKESKEGLPPGIKEGEPTFRLTYTRK